MNPITRITLEIDILSSLVDQLEKETDQATDGNMTALETIQLSIDEKLVDLLKSRSHTVEIKQVEKV